MPTAWRAGFRQRFVVAAAIALVTLAGCGGGGGGSSSTPPASNTNPPPASSNPPTLNNPGGRSVQAGSPLSFAVTATDSDGPGPLVLDISASTPALPAGVFTDNGGGNGTFNWTPTNAQAGTYTVTFRARENNGSGQASTQNVTITVNANSAPSLANPGNKTVIAGSSLTFGLSASDVDGPSPLVLDVSTATPALPAGVFIDNGGGNGLFNWTPTNNQAGTYNVTFRVRENGGNGQASTQNISIVVNANSAPNLINPGNRTVVASNNLSFAVTATDADGPGPLVLDISSSTPALPAGVFTDLGGGNGIFNWTPNSAQVGTYNVTFRARENNGAGQVSTQNVTITVAANTPPVLTNPGDRTVIASNNLSFAVIATDADGPAPLVLDISNSTPALPAGVFTDNGSGNGLFNWTPTSAQVGTYNVTFRARESSGSGQASTQNITITVNANTAPVLINPGNRTVFEGSNLNFAVTATDADGPAPLVLDISSSTPALPKR